MTSARVALTGWHCLERGCAATQFLDPNGANREVFLSPADEGTVVVVVNVGQEHELYVRHEQHGELAFVVPPQRAAFMRFTAGRWEGGVT